MTPASSCFSCLLSDASASAPSPTTVRDGMVAVGGCGCTAAVAAASAPALPPALLLFAMLAAVVVVVVVVFCSCAQVAACSVNFYLKLRASVSDLPRSPAASLLFFWCGKCCTSKCKASSRVSALTSAFSSLARCTASASLAT